MTETKPDSSTQAEAEAIVAEAFARHGHVARDPKVTARAGKGVKLKIRTGPMMQPA